MLKTWLSAMALVGTVLLCTAHAGVVYDLPKLVDSSDVVAVVKVVHVAQVSSGEVQVNGDPILAHFKTATLRAQCVLKSELPNSEITANYTQLYSPGGWAGGVPRGYTLGDNLTPGSSRLVFLKRAGANFEFTNGSYLSVVAPPESSGCTGAGDLFSQVVLCISDVLFSTATTAEEKREAIYQLASVNAPSAVPALKRFLHEDVAWTDRSLADAALFALLSHGDDSVLGLAESELLMPVNAAMWKFQEPRLNMMVALSHAIPASRSIPVLAKVLASGTPEVRTRAAEALYETNSMAAVPALLGALEDPSPRVAFAAMHGLGNLTRDYEWRPKSIDQDADWRACLDHWQTYRVRWKQEHTN